MRKTSEPHTPNPSSKASRGMVKALILSAVFVAALSSAGGVGVLVALTLLGVWLFLDIQDSTAKTQ